MKKLFNKRNEQSYQSGLDAIQNGYRDLTSLAAPLGDSHLSREFEAAQWLSIHKESLDPRPGFLTASRKRLIEAIRTEQIRRPALRPVFNFLNSRLAHQLVLAVLILAVFFTGNTVVQAADISIPGDPVYPVKLVLERIQVAVSFNSNQDTQLQIQFSQRRLSELQATILEGRYDYIPSVADAFQSQMSVTIKSIGQLNASDQQRVLAMISDFNRSLNIQSLTLTALATMIPLQERGGLSAAIDVSSHSPQRIKDLMKKN